MKERPILFSAPMVRAILDGSKTQTRRVVKGAALEWLADGMFTPEFVADPGNHLCPHGLPGDRLWVRETFVLESCVEHDQLPPFSDGRPIKRRPDEDFEGIAPLWIQPHYRATDPVPELAYEDVEEPTCRWKPSIFMPRWASRIALEVTGVRIERLNDISDEDAAAEGWPGFTDDNSMDSMAWYSTLWESINGADSWVANPWVWVIEFKRASATEHASVEPAGA